jgi:DNA invertase Pin-like site-specific DNA recombinase
MCAIYARAATGGRAAVDKQVRAAKEFLARNPRAGGRARPVKVYRDINSSGNNPPGPRLAALLADLAAGKINLVVTADVVRLGRSEDRRDSVMASIERAGARVMFFRDGRSCRSGERSLGNGRARRPALAKHKSKPKQHEAKKARVKAVAYYRPSARRGNDVPIPVQRERVRKFAEENNIEIVAEFSDRSRTLLSGEGRHNFSRMMEQYVIGDKKGRIDYVLVLDADRWARFRGVDLSAYFTGLCQLHGKQVVLATEGIPDDEVLMACRDSFAHVRRLGDTLFAAMDEHYCGSMSRIIELVARLLTREKADGRRRLLRQIRDIARAAAGR